VAQLKERDPDFPVDENSPYAELWMGTHANGPGRVSGKLLSSLIAKKAEVVANYPSAYEKFKVTGELPYLFKILSVRTALSIQAHPDKALAEKIHAAHPTVYKDDNHKPEMALAITPMEALCQFRPLVEIASHLETEPELKVMCGAAESLGLAAAAAAGQDNTPEGKAALQALFRTFMTSEPEKVSTQITALVARLSSLDWSMRTPTQTLVLRCNEQFPGTYTKQPFLLYLISFSST
jgi:mannose-6-phosphate isomerase